MIKSSWKQFIKGLDKLERRAELKDMYNSAHWKFLDYIMPCDPQWTEDLNNSDFNPLNEIYFLFKSPSDIEEFLFECAKENFPGAKEKLRRIRQINAYNKVYSSKQIKSAHTRPDSERFDENGEFIPYKPTEEELAKKDEIKKILEQELLEAYEPDPMDDYAGYDSTNERIDMACERVAKQFGVDTDFVDQIASEIQNEENARQYEEIEWAEKNLKGDEYDKWYGGELDVKPLMLKNSNRKLVNSGLFSNEFLNDKLKLTLEKCSTPLSSDCYKYANNGRVYFYAIKLEGKSAETPGVLVAYLPYSSTPQPVYFEEDVSYTGEFPNEVYVDSSFSPHIGILLTVNSNESFVYDYLASNEPYDIKNLTIPRDSFAIKKYRRETPDGRRIFDYFKKVAKNKGYDKVYLRLTLSYVARHQNRPVTAHVVVDSSEPVVSFGREEANVFEDFSITDATIQFKTSAWSSFGGDKLSRKLVKSDAASEQKLKEDLIRQGYTEDEANQIVEQRKPENVQSEKKAVKSSINYKINEEDILLFEGDEDFGGGIREHYPLSEIAKVEYAPDKLEDKLDKLGFDGGYKVTLKDGSVKYYGWKYGRSELTDVMKDLFESRKIVESDVDVSIGECRIDSQLTTTVRAGNKMVTLDETPAEHIKKNLDAYKGYFPYDMEKLVLEPSGYEKYRDYKMLGGKKEISYRKSGADEIVLYFDSNGELENIKSSRKPVDSDA